MSATKTAPAGAVLRHERHAGPDQLRAQAAAVKFIRTQMQPADLMAILSFSDGVHALRISPTIATTWRTRSTNYLSARARIRLHRRRRQQPDTGTAFGEDDSEFNLSTPTATGRAADGAQMLGTLNEKKVLIYFASGLRLSGVDNQAQFQATTNAAIRANVSFYSIDARGLVAQAPLGDATGDRRRPGDVFRRLGDGERQQFQKSQDTLYALAADTGGKALLDNNDLSVGIVQASNRLGATTFSLLLRQPGSGRRFRRIKITYGGDASPN